jgi:glycosyltransferase involved in cell wall biosynthesis
MQPLCVLIPVFNDWDAVGLLLTDLEQIFVAEHLSADVLLVDDCSTEPIPESFPGQAYQALQSIRILQLRRNLSHQRAIATGLVYLHQQALPEAIVIMDGDGEDRPCDIPKLLARFEREKRRCAVFAERTKRLESWTFRMFYHLYRAIHWLMTGYKVRMGNFSVLPCSAVERLVVVSEMWNHYAAAVIRSRLPYCTVPLPRGKRLSGHSKMNFISLLIHGLSAVSVFSDNVGARLFSATGLLIVLSTAGIALVFAVRLWTSLAIPGWATYATGFLVLVLLQAVSLSFVLVFLVLGNRAGASFLPIRDCPYFVRDVITVVETR